MRKPGGYATLTDEAGVRESDTFTCIHCNRVVHVKPKAQIGWCNLCYKPICPQCEAKGECTPFEKRLEMAEKRARFFCY